ncbi:MAG: methyltransferase family protein [Candidatus Hodarchaeales archaeon]
MPESSLKELILRTGVVVGVFGALVFIPAGTIIWAQAWLVFFIILVFMEGMVIYFWYKDKDLIQSRGSFAKPKERWDKFLFFALILSLFSELIVAGLDYRLKISDVPTDISTIAFIPLLCGLALYFFVMKENSYLSKVVEVKENQKVISTGPFKFVRHPLYLGNSILVVGLALTLSSFLALFPASFFITIQIIRIVKEEETLTESLKGYSEYKKRVKYRLIPFIW